MIPVYTSAGVPRLSLSVRQRHARMIMKETEQNYMSFKVGERNVVAFCLKVMIMHSGWLMFGHSVWRNFNSIPPITCRLSWKVNETVKLTKHTRPSLSTWMSWRVFWQCRRRCFFFLFPPVLWHVDWNLQNITVCQFELSLRKAEKKRHGTKQDHGRFCQALPRSFGMIRRSCCQCCVCIIQVEKWSTQSRFAYSLKYFGG
jgi:hypothetical protein